MKFLYLFLLLYVYVNAAIVSQESSNHFDYLFTTKQYANVSNTYALQGIYRERSYEALLNDVYSDIDELNRMDNLEYDANLRDTIEGVEAGYVMVDYALTVAMAYEGCLEHLGNQSELEKCVALSTADMLKNQKINEFVSKKTQNEWVQGVVGIALDIAPGLSDVDKKNPDNFYKLKKFKESLRAKAYKSAFQNTFKILNATNATKLLNNRMYYLHVERIAGAFVKAYIKQKFKIAEPNNIIFDYKNRLMTLDTQSIEKFMNSMYMYQYEIYDRDEFIAVAGRYPTLGDSVMWQVEREVKTLPECETIGECLGKPGSFVIGGFMQMYTELTIHLFGEKENLLKEILRAAKNKLIALNFEGIILHVRVDADYSDLETTGRIQATDSLLNIPELSHIDFRLIKDNIDEYIRDLEITTTALDYDYSVDGADLDKIENYLIKKDPDYDSFVQSPQLYLKIKNANSNVKKTLISELELTILDRYSHKSVITSNALILKRADINFNEVYTLSDGDQNSFVNANLVLDAYRAIKNRSKQIASGEPSAPSLTTDAVTYMELFRFYDWFLLKLRESYGKNSSYHKLNDRDIFPKEYLAKHFEKKLNNIKKSMLSDLDDYAIIYKLAHAGILGKIILRDIDFNTPIPKGNFIRVTAYLSKYVDEFLK